MNFKDSLRDLSYRETEISITELFPEIEIPLLEKRCKGLISLDPMGPHRAIYNIALELLKGGYGNFLNRFGFYDSDYGKFDGHCHQITPILGTILLAAGFKNVVYNECFRVDPETGKMVLPQEEKSEMKEEFCSIGRIPYCALGVEVNGEMFYLSGKHLSLPNGNPARALLTPDCYREAVGEFTHQENPEKSIIYLDQVTDIPSVKDRKPFTWKKQKINLKKDEELEPMEYFETFASMKLVLR